MKWATERESQVSGVKFNILKSLSTKFHNLETWDGSISNNYKVVENNMKDLGRFNIEID